MIIYILCITKGHQRRPSFDSPPYFEMKQKLIFFQFLIKLEKSKRYILQSIGPDKRKIIIKQFTSLADIFFTCSGFSSIKYKNEPLKRKKDFQV